MTPEYARGFWEAGDQILNFINSLDSCDMSAKDIRKAITHKVLEMRPEKRYNGRTRTTRE